MTDDQVTELAHSLARKLAARITKFVRQELRGEDITVGEVNQVVVVAALFCVNDALSTIKCKNCRGDACDHIEKVVPLMLADVRASEQDDVGHMH
jgi:hypothetical protein